jgi:hypothetical protein
VAKPKRRRKRAPTDPRPEQRVPIDYAQVERLAGINCTTEEMAYVLGVHANTLFNRRRDDPEFLAAEARGRSAVKISLRHKQLQLALAGDRTMLVWLGKVLLGQNEKLEMPTAQIQVEHTHHHDLAALEKPAHVAGVVDALRECGALESVLGLQEAAAKSGNGGGGPVH